MVCIFTLSGILDRNVIILLFPKAALADLTGRVVSGLGAFFSPLFIKVCARTNYSLILPPRKKILKRKLI